MTIFTITVAARTRRLRAKFFGREEKVPNGVEKLKD